MKNNQKCVRLSDETLKYIESFQGEGFNQKLENMVTFVSQEETKIKGRIEKLEEYERRLTASVGNLSRMENSLTSIKRCLNEAKKIADNAALPGQLKIG